MKNVFLPIAAVLCLATIAHAEGGAGAEPKEDKVQQGWDNVKKGTHEVADGVSKGVNEAGLEAKSLLCPVVAETEGKVYYAKDSKGYVEALRVAAPDKDVGTICFRSEAAAREKGFKAVAK